MLGRFFLGWTELLGVALRRSTFYNKKVCPMEGTFCKGVTLVRALLATWVPQEGQILSGGCPREGTFCEGVALGGALFVKWVLQEGQILRGGCPREGTFCDMGPPGGADLRGGCPMEGTFSEGCPG